MKKKARPVTVVEEEPELIVDQEVRSPPPLDKRIASVWMWTPTNNVTDGYDLVVSAAFGADRVILKGDGFELDVNFGVKSADIEVQPWKCTLTVIRDGRSDEAHTTIKNQTRLEARYKTGVGLELAGSDSGGTMRARLGGEYGNAGSHIVMMQRKEKRLDYYPIGDNTIQVGQRDGPVLNGPIIQDFKGWRVTPSVKTERSAVLARLKHCLRCSCEFQARREEGRNGTWMNSSTRA